MQYETECSISAAVEVIRSEFDELASQGCTSSVDVIREACSDIDAAVECDNDRDSEDESTEFTSLIPSDMSAGDADELKDVILNWRKEHGYGIPS